MSNIQKQHKISPAIAWLTIQKFIIFYCPLDGEHTIYGGFLFVLYFLSGLTEEERHMCIKVFDKICNNAEEHLREYKRSMFNNERKQL